MLWMFFGMCFFSFAIGSLSSMLSSIDTKDTILMNKLGVIDEFAKEANLTKNMCLRIRRAIKYSTEKSGYSLGDKHTILSELPRNLRYEMAIAMHHGVAMRLDFFMKRDQVFISSIVPFLQHHYQPEKEYIYQESEHADEIYFLVKGRVSYVLHQTKLAFKSIPRGTYFGDIEIVLDIQRKYSVLTQQNCEMLTMNKQIIGIIQTEFQYIWKQMKDLAYQRDEHNTRAQEEFKIYLQLKKAGKLVGKTPGDIRDMVKKLQLDRSANLSMISSIIDDTKHEIAEPKDDIEMFMKKTNKRIDEIESKVVRMKETTDQMFSLMNAMFLEQKTNERKPKSMRDSATNSLRVQLTDIGVETTDDIGEMSKFKLSSF